ncbi:MAG: MoaF N-terminal domain-containing protein [Victivallaceae bacterium]|nr:MoaF N-terminal domain-containing protein [Victivallaceae bacterium]
MKALLFAGLWVGMALAMTGCSTVDKIEASILPNSIDVASQLVGKTYEYNYGVDTYIVHFKSDKVLHWRGIAGGDKGNQAEENYTIQKVSDNVFFIAWIEKSGWKVAQVLDFNTMQVKCYWFLKGQLIPVNGTVKIVQ